VRVILTTNFDRLIEQALEAEGILPQVIASPNAIAGMEPLAHARCTVVKLHGDYSSLEQLNTVEELSVYAKTTRGLLHRVLDEYGLLICGWSGDWDSALVDAIERTRSRRYPLFWASYGELGDVAKRLIAQHRAQVIAGAVADQFFPDLVSRLEALDSLADPPLTLSMAVARLKRMLPDDSKYIELRDLFDAQVARVRMLLSNRAHVAPSMEPQAWENAHEEFRRDLDILLHLLAQGVFLDRDRQHTDLWVWVIEQLMRARTFASGAVDGNWDSMQHYPALLALRTVGLAAVAAKHDDVLIRALQEPTWRDRFNNQRLIPAFAALHDYKVLDAHNIETFPVWAGSRPHFPISRWLRRALQSIFLPIVGDEDSYAMLCSRLEYRVALAQAVFDGGSLAYRSAPGEFVGEWQWTEDELAWEADFRQNGDGAAWGWTAGIDGEPDEFSEALTALTTELKRSRRW
jgi:hypothetical protein